MLFIYFIFFIDNNKVIAGKEGAIEAVANMLKKHKNNKGLERYAIEILKNIKQGSTKNANDVRKVLESDSELKPFISEVF